MLTFLTFKNDHLLISKRKKLLHWSASRKRLNCTKLTWLYQTKYYLGSPEFSLLYDILTYRGSLITRLPGAPPPPPL